MPDQAAGLRSLFAKRRPALLVVAGTDAGQAAVAVHFAREAAAGGRATLLVDDTAGQAASACDVACRYELAHVLAGDKAAADVIRPITRHLLLLPAARALSRFDTLDAAEHARLGQLFSTGIADALRDAGADDAQVDLIVVNAAEGRGERAIEAFGRDARVVIVASGAAASLTGAYLQIRSLAQGAGIEQFEVVEPVSDGATDAATVTFANLAAAADRFLDLELVDGGRVAIGRSRPLPAAVASTPSHAEDEVQHAAVA